MRFEIDEAALAQLPESQRVQVMAKVAQARDRIRSNPLELYAPHSRQAPFHESRAASRAFFGGNRAGKTTAGVVDDLIEVVPAELLPERLRAYKRPEWTCPRHIRVVNPSTKLIRSAIVEKFRQWTPKPLLKGGKFFDAYSKYDLVLQLECGCSVDFLSYEMTLDKFGGVPKHRVHYDEEPPEQIREEGIARLADYGGTEVFTMTPLLGMTWMYDSIWLSDDPDIFKISASTLDNPTLDPEGVARMIERYAGSEEMLEARIHGRFVHFGGLVYPLWRDWIVAPPLAAELQGRLVLVGIDPGVAGFGLVFAAWSERDRKIEVFASRKLEGDEATVENAAAVVREMGARWRFAPEAAVLTIDPNSRYRSPHARGNIVDEFRAHGFIVNPGNNELEAGVLVVRARGAARLLTVSSDCDELVGELGRYRKQDREDGVFAVVKVNDHCCDALRYMVMERPWTPAAPARRPAPDPDVATGPPRPDRRQRTSVMGWGA